LQPSFSSEPGKESPVRFYYEVTVMKKLINLFTRKPNPHSQTRKRKLTGQGMVEFALVLPILLMVAYGLLETGRLLFIYSSTVTAARQAARYGSATGRNDGGIPYYRDCTGIRDAAQNVGFLNNFEDGDIAITYDRGLNNAGVVVAIPGINADPTVDTCNSMNDSTLQTGDRIKVQVSTVWTPIVAVVPSWQGFTITSSSERTILTEIAIGSTPSGGGTWGGPSGALHLNANSPVTSYDEVGDILTYTYTLTNTAILTIQGPFSVTDNRAATNCNDTPNSLSPSSSTTCTGTYTITQADLDAGSVVNLATASSAGATSNQISLTIPAIQNKQLTLLDITPNPPVAASAGTIITYTYRFQNSGNVTLSSPYTISDNKVSSANISCVGATTPLPPGSITECTGTYSISAAELSSGSLTNTASVKATFNGVETAASNSKSATVVTSSLQLSVTAPASVSTIGEITYVYTLKNVSPITLNAAYQVTDSRVPSGSISCPSGDILPGETIQCIGKYLVTQTDLNNGTALTSQAIASANSGTVSSNTANTSVSISQLPAISLTAATSTNLVTALPASITYSYSLKNEGNVTLNAPFIIMNSGLSGASACAIASGSVEPGATIPCALNYSVQQSDLDAGSIINTASITVPVNGINYTAQAAPTTVITHNSPRITLSITSSVNNFGNSGIPIRFSFKLANTGNSPLSAPYSVTVSTPAGITVTCPNSPSTLDLGQSVTCTADADYITTMTDFTNKIVTVTATGFTNNGALGSQQVIFQVPYASQCYVYHRVNGVPFPSVTVTGSPQRIIQMTIFNDSATGSAIEIQQVQLIGWDQAGNTITSIQFGGNIIWSGSSGPLDPYTFNITTGNRSLNPGENKLLALIADKNISKTGVEQIKVTFTNSNCPILDTSNGTQVK